MRDEEQPEHERRDVERLMHDAGQQLQDGLHDAGQGRRDEEQQLHDVEQRRHDELHGVGRQLLHGEAQQHEATLHERHD